MIQDHVLLPSAGQLDEVNERFSKKISIDDIIRIVDAIPDEWLMASREMDTPEEMRSIYIEFLTTRLAYSNQFVKEAKDARETLI